MEARMIGLLFNALKKLVLAESHAARRLLLGLLLIAVALTGRNSSGLAKAADNPIVIENQQPGSSGWQLTLNSASDGTGQIKGYASATSVNKGQSITFYVSVNPAQSYSIDVYRIGEDGSLSAATPLPSVGAIPFGMAFNLTGSRHQLIVTDAAGALCDQRRRPHTNARDTPRSSDRRR